MFCPPWPCAVFKLHRSGLDDFRWRIAGGKHLFPFRTEQLSPSAPMVLGGQPPGRVGRRRFTSPPAPAADRGAALAAGAASRMAVRHARPAPSRTRQAWRNRSPGRWRLQVGSSSSRTWVRIYGRVRTVFRFCRRFCIWRPAALSNPRSRAAVSAGRSTLGECPAP
jgi:hypothetical protein